MAKNLVLWLIIAAVLLSVFQNFSPTAKEESVSYSSFIEEVQTGRIDSVVLEGLTVEVRRADGSTFKTTRPDVPDTGLMSDLLNNNVNVEGREPEPQSLWTQLLVAAFPIL